MIKVLMEKYGSDIMNMYVYLFTERTQIDSMGLLGENKYFPYHSNDINILLSIDILITL